MSIILPKRGKNFFKSFDINIVIIKGEFCLSETPLTWATLALHRQISF